MSLLNDKRAGSVLAPRPRTQEGLAPMPRDTLSLPTCECGCGKRPAKPGSRFVPGHNRPSRRPVTERFWQYVRQTHTCWAWLGSTRKGYGQFYDGSRNIGAHRFAYELLVGPIPDGLHIDHLCNNRGCVNPQHMEPVTIGENVHRGVHVRFRDEGSQHGFSKRCRDCGEVKPLTEFHKHRRRLDGHDIYCGPCNNARERARYERVTTPSLDPVLVDSLGLEAKA